MSQDPTEEAINEFVAATQAAAKNLANRLTKIAADRTFAVMQRAFDFEPKEPEKNYTMTVAADTVNGFRNPQRPKVKIYTDDALRQQAIDFVKKYPGYRVEQIATRLGVKPRDLARQLTKAVASGKVAKKGYGRATKYHPGKKA